MNTLSYTMYIDCLYCTLSCLINFSPICASARLSNDSCAKEAHHELLEVSFVSAGGSSLLRARHER